MNTSEQEIRRAFEAWWCKEYEWYITRKRRGYSLELKDDGDYFWPRASDDYRVWKAAFKLMNENGE